MTKNNVTETCTTPAKAVRRFRIDSVRLDDKPFEPARTNYFSVYLIESGSGTFWADASQFAFDPGSLLFFVPYQHIRFAPDARFTGGRSVPRQLPVRRDVPRRGRVQRPAVQRPLRHPRGRAGRTGEVGREAPDRTHSEGHEERDLAYSEAMLAHLKVLLILATRLKSAQGRCVRAGDGPAASGPHRTS